MTDRPIVGDDEMEAAVKALAAGRLVVFPTETVYGIGCDALDGDALARLCAAKRRAAEKGISVIVADRGMLDQVTESVSAATDRLGATFWPGPLTILVPAREELPDAIVRDGQTACRVSSDPVARRLAAELGRPIAAPSANPADREPAHDGASARRYFGDEVAVYLDDGQRHGAASTLIDPGPPLRVLRSGPIGRAEIETALE